MAEKKDDALPDVPAHLRAAATTKELLSDKDLRQAKQLLESCLGEIDARKFPVLVPAAEIIVEYFHPTIYGFGKAAIDEVCKKLRAAGYSVTVVWGYMKYRDGYGDITSKNVLHVRIDNPLKSNKDNTAPR